MKKIIAVFVLLSLNLHADKYIDITEASTFQLLIFVKKLNANKINVIINECNKTGLQIENTQNIKCTFKNPYSSQIKI